MSIGKLKCFVGADYSGIEVRLLCIASGDKLLTQQFNSGMDVHSLVGHELTGIPAAKIKSDKVTRRKVKEFHFGIVYGLGAENGPQHMKAKGAPITKAEFMRFQKRYFTRYSGVKLFIDKCRHEVEEYGSVRNIFGFRCTIEKGDERRGSFYLNRAINTPIQGAAHTLLLIAMAILRDKPVTYKVLQEPVMEVHDELCFVVPFEAVLEADIKLRELLQEAVAQYIERHFFKLSIPLVAEVSAGFTRGTMVKYEDELGQPLPLPPLPQFLEDWRAKYRKVSELPLTELMTLD